jgi:hypothetical protein
MYVQVHTHIYTHACAQDFSTIGSWLPEELDEGSQNSLLVRTLQILCNITCLRFKNWDWLVLCVHFSAINYVA